MHRHRHGRASSSVIQKRLNGGATATATEDDISILSPPKRLRHNKYSSSSPPSELDTSWRSHSQSDTTEITPDPPVLSSEPQRPSTPPQQRQKRERPKSLALSYLHSPMYDTPPPARRASSEFERNRIERLQDSITRLRQTRSPRPKRLRQKKGTWTSEHWKRLERLIAPLKFEKGNLDDFPKLPRYVLYEFDDFAKEELQARALAIARAKAKAQANSKVK